MAVVIQIDGYDPIGGLPVTLRAASHDDPRVCHLGEMLWWPAIAKLPTLRYDLFDGSFSAQITSPTSSLSLQTEQWPDFGRYALANARIQLWTGELGAAWAAWTQRVDGRISSQPQLAAGVASIDFGVDDSWLDAALLATYAGTTGIEGPADLKGQAKPLALGAPRYVSGKLIDSVNSVFQISAYGAIKGVEAALEKLARFDPPVGDRAGYAELVAAAIPAGKWATARAAGLVRFGAPPSGTISFLVQGDVAGTDGWARRPGQLIRRLATLSGGAGRIDDVSLNALDVARPYNLSIYVDEQTTARDLIQRLAASVNAVAGVSWLGKLFVLPVGLAPSRVTLSADGSTLPPVRSVEQIENAAPWQKLAIGAERAWTVHALADIAFTATLVDVGAYNAVTTYREGNIVSLPNGSRWLYVNTAAAAGHVPGNDAAFWKELNPPIGAGDITYDDGTPLEDLKPAEPGATAGAPAGTKVAGRPAEEIVASVDINVQALLAAILNGDELNQALQAMASVNGQPVSIAFLDFKGQQLGVNDANAYKFSLLGAQAPDGTAFVLDATKVMVAPGKSLAQFMTEVSAAQGDTSATVQLLMEALVNDGSAYSKAILRTDADGVFGAFAITADGAQRLSRISMVADELEFVDRNGGGSPIKALYYADGVWQLADNLYVRNLFADTVTTKHIKADNITGILSMSFPDLAIVAAESTVAEATFQVGDAVDGKATVDINFVQDSSAHEDTAATIRAYVDTGSGYQLVRQTNQGIVVKGASAYWILPVGFRIPIMASGKVSVKVTAQGYSGLQGSYTSGSRATNILMSIFQGSR
ncbi:MULTISPECIES: hypothetical protein [unclassified Sphingomonas]|uniref:hypothetical protein n=1 Tax=unclassified Sphingomonas TaxID=196159 RepID=UPI00226AF058|nr:MULTISPECIES: hypothetical protein [unclassified Sphingomonas]